MTEVDEHRRPEPPIADDEVATLLGFLDYQRATLARKCAGVDAAGPGTTVGASSMTLGGLLKHMAYVESDWFSRVLHANKAQPPWDTVAWVTDPTAGGDCLPPLVGGLPHVAGRISKLAVLDEDGDGADAGRATSGTRGLHRGCLGHPSDWVRHTPER